MRSAATTHGVTTVANAQSLGVTQSQLRTLIRNGHLMNPHRGLLVATAAPRSWLQDCSIAVQWSRGVLSHRAAAQIHGMDGFSKQLPEVTVAVGKAIPMFEWPAHRSSRLDKVDVTSIEGLPVTSIARTLVDLGAVVDQDKVEAAVDWAFRAGVSPTWIKGELARLDRSGPSGSGVLKNVLALPDRNGPLPDSQFERLVERLCVEGGLPQPVRQYIVTDSGGKQIARLDTAWPEAMLGLEAHSQRWHSGARSVRSDQKRDNLLTALGWDLMYATWSHVQDPGDFIAQVRMAYYRRLALHTPGRG